MKQANFVMLDEYADWEGSYLSSTLNQSPDWVVQTASINKEVISIGGFKTLVDYDLKKIPTDCDLLVLIGGNSWSIENDVIKQVIKDRLINNKFVGAVDYLAQNGLLDNFKHTGNAQYLWKDFDQYRNKIDFIEKSAVSDHNLVTANGTAPLEFTREVLKLICFKDNEQIDKDIYLFKYGFYQYCKKYGDPYI